MPYLCVLTIAFQDCRDDFGRLDETRVVTQYEALIFFLLKFIDENVYFYQFHRSTFLNNAMQRFLIRKQLIHVLQGLIQAILGVIRESYLLNVFFHMMRFILY